MNEQKSKGLYIMDCIPIGLGSKLVPDLEASSLLLDLLCSVCGLPLVEPRQTTDCGCRVCVQCYFTLKKR